MVSRLSFSIGSSLEGIYRVLEIERYSIVSSSLLIVGRVGISKLPTILHVLMDVRLWDLKPPLYHVLRSCELKVNIASAFHQKLLALTLFSRTGYL